ncbi:MAG: SH3 domain-containing protein [Chloroflexi bacterium]|nr:SH3 domain-containing protein [Chloroflexota bacterium]
MTPKSSILLVVLVLVAAACAPRQPDAPATPDVPIPTATLTPTPTASPTPTRTATPAIVIAPLRSATAVLFPATVVPVPVCQDTPRSRMIVQARGQVTSEDPSPLNVRESASIRAEVLTQLQARSLFYVLDGPRCADGYAWFRIRARGVEGWVAEGDSENYYIEPILP